MVVNACRMVASALRDVENGSPSSAQDCSDVIHILVFFDGTGNNKETDEERKKWSNVARIWRSADAYAKANKNANVYPIYISGVGTPFNGQPLFPGDVLKIAIEDGSLTGGAGGAGGARRLEHGRQQVNDALRGALLARARTLGGQVSRYAKAGEGESFSEVNKALGKHRLIKQINVSIFGFSRGAALARAFCNEWLWQCEEDHEKLLYAGYPIRFSMLGLFDTVASFGLASTNLANNPALGGFKGRDLVVDQRVERCVHFVAAHELRFSFPVDLIRRDGKLPGHWLETTYPGVHSDIGGGYEPKDQGIDDNYARIPMRDMMREALLQGTRLFGYKDIEQRSYTVFQERFECRPKTETAYRAYATACSPGGTIEEQVRAHMAQLYSAYGTLHRQGGESVTQRQHRAGKSWSRLAPGDMAAEVSGYEKALAERNSLKGKIRSALNPTYAIRKGAYLMWISPDPWQLDAWRRRAGDGVMQFVHTYVHDSKVGFLSNAEPFSYFSKRGVSESTRSVQGWFENAVARPTGRAYEATADKATELKDAAIKKGRQVKDAAVDTGKKVGNAAVNTGRRVGNAVVETGRQVGNAAVETGKQIGHAVSETGKQVGSAISDGAQHVGQAVSKTTSTAANALKSAWQYVF